MKKSTSRMVEKPRPQLDTGYPAVGELALLAAQLLGKSDALDVNAAAEKALSLWRASAMAIYAAKEAEVNFPAVVYEDWYIQAKKAADDRYIYPSTGKTLTFREAAKTLYEEDEPNSMKLLAALVRKNGQKASQRVTVNQFRSWAVWREVERLEIQEATKSKWGRDMAAKREEKKKTKANKNSL
jgi:hypothetical protein